MIATCVAGGAREFLRGRDKRRLRRRRPEGFPAAKTKVTLPLLFSTNNDAIGNPAATGMLDHAVMPPHDVVMLSHPVSCWAMPPCCVKDDGERTPPISQLLDEYITFSDVAALVAATEPPSVPFASSLSGSASQAPHPSFGGAALDPAAGIAHCAFQPTSGHSHCDGQANAPLDAVPTTSLATAANANIASKVVVPHCGQATVVSTTGDAYCALQPFSAQSALA
jgi:hypothetical protein